MTSHFQTPLEALQAAIASTNGQAALAKSVGISSTSPRSVVWAWLDRGQAAQEYCPAIERATGVPCEALRPDIRWRRVADEAWPWHPEGRPLIDVTAEAA